MTQLTIRGFDDELAQVLQEQAKTQGISLNKAALCLLRRGAGLEDAGTQPEVIGRSLDPFIGTWSAAQAEELRETLKDFGKIDESFWA